MKKTILSIIMASLFAALYAMPGFDSYIPDQSGEYVYYKDNTFNRESYVGILFYNESTFQIRYYAPQDKVALLPEKDLSILLTINPDLPYWQMTGERMPTTIMPGTEDVDLVNYMHDLLYEFSAHRIKAEIVESREMPLAQEYEQFGGSVTIVYDCTIPMFNIRDILDVDGNAQLKCITTGRLQNNGDSSFDDFKGAPDATTAATANGKKAKAKKEKATKCTFEGQSLTLDETWEQKMENLWVLGNDAVASLGSLPAYNEDKNLNECYILRRLLENSDYRSINIKKEKNRIILSTENCRPEGENRIISVKILTAKKDSNDFDCFSLTVFKNAWSDNFSYYQKIIKSYSN